MPRVQIFKKIFSIFFTNINPILVTQWHTHTVVWDWSPLIRLNHFYIKRISIYFIIRLLIFLIPCSETNAYDRGGRGILDVTSVAPFLIEYWNDFVSGKCEEFVDWTCGMKVLGYTSMDECEANCLTHEHGKLTRFLLFFNGLSFSLEL